MTSYIALGYACNHNCICCPIDPENRVNSSTNNLELSDVIATLDLDNKTDVSSVIISGGEPTLSPIFFDVVSYLTKHGINITLLSNSESFSNNEYINKLLEHIDTNHFRVVTAIHCSNKNIHDRITQKERSFEKTLTGLNNLLDNGVEITVKHIINKLNYPYLNDFAHFICRSFKISVPVEFCSMDYCGMAGINSSELYAHFDEIKPFLESAIDIIENENNKQRNIYITETPLCALDPYYWRYYPLRENPNLEYYAAPNVKTENKSLKDIPSQCGTYYKECSECIVKKICSGVWKSAYDLQKHKLLNTIENQ